MSLLPPPPLKFRIKISRHFPLLSDRKKKRPYEIRLDTHTHTHTTTVAKEMQLNSSACFLNEGENNVSHLVIINYAHLWLSRQISCPWRIPFLRRIFVSRWYRKCKKIRKGRRYRSLEIEQSIFSYITNLIG